MIVIGGAALNGGVNEERGVRWISRTSVSPIDLSSAANLWRLSLSREISAILYPALANRRLGADKRGEVVIEGLYARRGTSSTRGVPHTCDNKDGTNGHDIVADECTIIGLDII